MEGAIRHSKNGFGKVLTGSFIAHGAVIALVLFVYRNDAKKVFTPVYNVSLVDPSALEDKTIGKEHSAAPVAAPQKNAEKKAEKKETILKKAAPKKPQEQKEAVKPPEPHKSVPVPGPRVSAPAASAAAEKAPSVDDAIARLKRSVKEREERTIVDARIETLKKRHSASNGEAKAGVDAHQAPAAKQAAGTDTQGELKAATATGAMAPGKNTAYSNLVATRVQEQWIYPAEFKRDKISVIVSIRIGKSGNLLAAWVEQSSGSLRFDDSLIDAIKKAAPFPPLPHNIDGDSFELGLRFCPYCK